MLPAKHPLTRKSIRPAPSAPFDRCHSALGQEFSVRFPHGRIVTSLLRLGLFLGFVAGAVIVAGAKNRPEDTRRTITTGFLLYALCASFAVGLIQREAWPFSNWPMDNNVLDTAFASFRLAGVDAGGREYPLDLRAFQPVAWGDLSIWVAQVVPQDPATFDAAAPWLIDRLNGARARVEAGGSAGTWDRFWGPLTAPETVLLPKIWRAQDKQPPIRFVGLRVYVDHSNLNDDPSGAPSIRPELIHQVRR